jgi:uncharacterized protein YcbK (DUF882 family)
MASEKVIQLNNTLSSELLSANIIAVLPEQSRNAYRESVREASLEIAEEAAVNIDLSSNQLMNDIPNNLVGKSNPVDVVSSNLTNNQLKNNLLPDVSGTFQGPLTNALASLIASKFSSKLPPVLSSTINNLNLNSLLRDASSSAVGLGIEGALSSFAGDVFGKKLTIPPVVPNITSFFGGGDADKALQVVNQQFDSAISNDAFAEAQKFDIKNEKNEEKLLTKTYGFIDPTATYPTEEYRGRAETNLLAQGEVNNTIVQKKEKERILGIQLPNEARWEQPPVPYKAEYPYNKVIETESGHIIEYDDTPGGERIHIYHRTGTFIEIDSNGSIVKRTKGSSYEIVDKNGYISVSGDAHLSVKGSIKIYVGGDADIEVDGDTNIKCFNDITMQAAGRVDISATEEINLHSANINIEADVNLNIKADNVANVSANAIFNFSNTSIYNQAVSSTHFVNGNGFFSTTSGSTNFVSGTRINLQSVSDINLLSSRDINQDGRFIFFNSNRASGATSATTSQIAINSNIGLIGTRRDIVKQDIPNPVAANYLDKDGYKAEDAEDEKEAVDQQNKLKKFGITDDNELSEPSVEVEKETPASKKPTIIKPSDTVLAETFLPENYQLSKHYTLANLSTKAAVSSYKVVPQNGLSYGQIVYNLQGIALNILEPVLALYPNMIVTSAFRAVAGSSSTSDHTKGKAVDMQFKGVSKAEYYEIAKKLATQLNYDKLLLEYKTYGTGMPWIHISFDVNAPRGIVLTYLNDKKYGEGLSNLA